MENQSSFDPIIYHPSITNSNLKYRKMLMRTKEKEIRERMKLSLDKLSKTKTKQLVQSMVYYPGALKKYSRGVKRSPLMPSKYIFSPDKVMLYDTDSDDDDYVDDWDSRLFKDLEENIPPNYYQRNDLREAQHYPTTPKKRPSQQQHSPSNKKQKGNESISFGEAENFSPVLVSRERDHRTPMRDVPVDVATPSTPILATPIKNKQRRSNYVEENEDHLDAKDQVTDTVELVTRKQKKQRSELVFTNAKRWCRCNGKVVRVQQEVETIALSFQRIVEEHENQQQSVKSPLLSNERKQRCRFIKLNSTIDRSVQSFVETISTFKLHVPDANVAFEDESIPKSNKNRSSMVSKKRIKESKEPPKISNDVTYNSEKRSSINFYLLIPQSFSLNDYKMITTFTNHFGGLCRFYGKESSPFDTTMVTHVIAETAHPDSDVVANVFFEHIQAVGYRRYIVSKRWIVESLRSDCLLEAEPYELRLRSDSEVPAARLARETGRLLFSDMALLCARPFKNFSQHQLEDLLRVNGAIIVNNPKELKEIQGIREKYCIVGERKYYEKPKVQEILRKRLKITPLIKYQWVFECLIYFRKEEPLFYQF